MRTQIQNKNEKYTLSQKPLVVLAKFAVQNKHNNKPLLKGIYPLLCQNTEEAFTYPPPFPPFLFFSSSTMSCHITSSEILFFLNS